MGADKFKFISPGVFTEEIDESGIPALPERMGPLVIGRFEKGPSNRPVKVNSFREFVSIFGNPSAGSVAGDVWRSGEATAPTYAAYAVQAWLRNNSPCTVYRVLGEQADNATAGSATALAGWATDRALGKTLASAGGAYGLFILPNPDKQLGDATKTATARINIVQGNHKVALDLAEEDSGTDGATATGQIITITDHASRTVDYIISNTGAAGGVATGTVIADGGVSNTGTTYTATANADAGVALGVQCESDGDDMTQLLTVLKAAIEHENGHNGSITVGSIQGVVTSSQYLILTQASPGVWGNTAITENVGNLWVSAEGASTGADTFSGGEGPLVTGSLAAVWYVQDGAVVLTGTARDGRAQEGAGILIKGDGGSKFTVKVVKDAMTTVQKQATFNFDRDSDLFIRKVFNTDPTKTNDEIIPTSETTQSYWLGETFESNFINAENSKLAVTGTVISDTDDVLGIILGLEGSANLTWANHQLAARAAQTGWFISQDTRGSTTTGFDPTAHTEKLFKFHALDSGESANRDFKISIKSIKAPSDNFNKYGTFTIELRRHRDTDSKPTVVEQFSSLNLNPKSGNYIGRVIGDMYTTYDPNTKVIRDHGDNPNRSQHIRVEVAPVVADAGAEGLLPLGVFGPLVPASHRVLSGSTSTILAVGSGSSDCLPWETLRNASTAAGDGAHMHGPNQLTSETSTFTASFEFPTSRLRVSSSEGGLVLGSKAYFGYQSTIKDTKRFDATNLDLHRGAPSELDPTGNPAVDSTQYSWVFTLDDVRTSAADSNHAVYLSGSRAGATSLTAGGTYKTVLDAGYNKFTSPMFGGLDGFDITEQDPLRNSYIDGGTEKTNSSFYSIKKAIDVVSDKDFIEYDLVTMPGVTNSSLNSSLINLCEDRADALAVVDVAGGYVPPSGRKTSETDSDSLGSVTSTVSNLKTMGVNSSYGCAFYPWVKIRDNINDALLYVPPSVVALGTFSSSQRKSEVWFAPAGFTRGGLSEGSAGLPVVGVRQRLTSADRDKLYDANVNPIASFPAEGIVVFGQKTLQVTPSALDRINVRRLLIHVKKEISRISSTLLFEQNVQETWQRFLGEVEPFLDDIKSGLGLTDFKVVLDKTTTTPDLVDRNILYAKIFLKPARAIEFIALDFIITRSGASFDD